MNSPSEMTLFNRVQKDFSKIDLKSFFSLAPFKSLVEGIVVSASLGVAAVVVPQILNLALGSIIALIATGGFIAACYGGYQWYKSTQVQLQTEEVNQMKSLTYIGGAALALSLTLSFSSALMPLMLAAIVGHRSLSALTEDHWRPIEQMRDTVTSYFSFSKKA